ncbi:MAG: pyridoxamine 5'-phosphate oxidase [Burkholderiales bacterium]
MTIADLRKDYKLASLSEHDAPPSPYTLFERWFNEAIAADLPEPNAMTLATVGASGKPSARIMLLKAVDESGFSFYTNYTSRKGHELATQPVAALVFHWVELERQVRIEGLVEKVSAELATHYFNSRPRLSRIGAWASPQSQVISDRDFLEREFAAADKRYPEDVPLPPYWGGYRVIPEMIEFWQGRRSRLHDRLAYQRAEGRWRIERLAP